jgi:hypothetical protein
MAAPILALPILVLRLAVANWAPMPAIPQVTAVVLALALVAPLLAALTLAVVSWAPMPATPQVTGTAAQLLMPVLVQAVCRAAPPARMIRHRRRLIRLALMPLAAAQPRLTRPRRHAKLLAAPLWAVLEVKVPKVPR